jgi:photosystem II cytochrome c550
MLKKYSQLFSVLFFSIFSMSVMTASAIDLDDATRTVVKDGSGKTIVLTPEQVKRGKRLFNATCGACHVGGITKTNPNVGLDPEALSLATPRRDNIDALVDYLKNPTSYDGFESIAEVHPRYYPSPSKSSRSLQKRRVCRYCWLGYHLRELKMDMVGTSV